MEKMKKTEPKFSIVMANYNGYNPTSKALKSLRNLTYPNFDIIVVDDCSSDDSAERLKNEFPEITILKSPKNGGLNRSYNIGIDHALRNGTEYVFTCQNDTYDYSPNILEVILQEFQKNSKIGMVGPTILDSYGNFRWNGVDKNKLGVIMNISECFTIKREVYEKIGLFNEKLVVYFEDLDLIVRLRKAGYLTSAVTSVRLTHSGQVTFSKQKFRPNYLRSRNLAFYINHYYKKKKLVGLLYNMYSNFRYVIMPRISESFKANDFFGMFYLILGYFSGVLIGCFMKWEEEKPWAPENKYPHR